MNSSTNRSTDTLLYPALFILLAAAYWPLRHAGYIWDDPSYVINNQTLKTLHGLFDIWFTPNSLPQFYPMVHTSFWIEYRFWGLNPLGYHLVNLALHFIGTILIYRVLKLLSVPFAAFAVILFAIHPVNVESVAWITERKNVLSLVFYFWALYQYLRFYGFESGHDSPSSEPNRFSSIFYLSALLLYSFAILSKTVTCSLPAVILILIWWKTGHLSKKDIKRLVPFFLIGIVFALITIRVEIGHVGATGNDFDFTIWQRLIIAGKALLFYLSKLIVPYHLCFFYPVFNIQTHTLWPFLYPMAEIAIAFLLLIFAKKIGRSALAAYLIYGGTLFPALGFFNIYPMRYSFVADHFQYLASVAAISYISALFMKAQTKVIGSISWFKTRPKTGKYALYVLPGIIVVIFSILTYHQTLNYKDEKTLYQNTLKVNPAAWIALNNLGGLYGRQGDYQKALPLIEKAIKLKPDYIEAFINLSVTYEHIGNIHKAEDALQAILKIYPENSLIHYHLGNFYLARGKIQRAVFHFQTVTMLEPNAIPPRLTLGYLLEKMGEDKLALQQFRAVVKIDPNQKAAKKEFLRLRDKLLYNQ